jgi:hypothetical protein
VRIMESCRVARSCGWTRVFALFRSTPVLESRDWMRMRARRGSNQGKRKKAAPGFWVEWKLRRMEDRRQGPAIAARLPCEQLDQVKSSEADGEDSTRERQGQASLKLNRGTSAESTSLCLASSRATRALLLEASSLEARTAVGS